MNDNLRLLAMYQSILKQVCQRKNLVLRINKKNLHKIFALYSKGRGKSKKEAKRLAAHQMWQRLQDLPADNQEDAADDVSKIRFTI